jgi:hypothetical protein
LVFFLKKSSYPCAASFSLGFFLPSFSSARVGREQHLPSFWEKIPPPLSLILISLRTQATYPQSSSPSLQRRVPLLLPSVPRQAPSAPAPPSWPRVLCLLVPSLCFLSTAARKAPSLSLPVVSPWCRARTSLGPVWFSPRHGARADHALSSHGALDRSSAPPAPLRAPSSSRPRPTSLLCRRLARTRPQPRIPMAPKPSFFLPQLPWRSLSPARSLVPRVFSARRCSPRETTLGRPTFLLLPAVVSLGAGRFFLLFHAAAIALLLQCAQPSDSLLCARGISPACRAQSLLLVFLCDVESLATRISLLPTLLGLCRACCRVRPASDPKLVASV